MGPEAVVQSCDTFSLSLAGLTHPQRDPKWQHCGAVLVWSVEEPKRQIAARLADCV